MMLLVKLTMTVKMEPRLVPESPDIAVASEDNVCVKIPVLCSGRSKKAISCLIIDLNDWYRTLRTYIQYHIGNGLTIFSLA